MHRRGDLKSTASASADIEDCAASASASLVVEYLHIDWRESPIEAERIDRHERLEADRYSPKVDRCSAESTIEAERIEAESAVERDA